MSDNQLLHLHGASIGEVSCLLLALDKLRTLYDMKSWGVLLTFTSTSAETWIKRRGIASDIKTQRYGGETLNALRLWQSEGRYEKYALIVAEKDRRLALLRFYTRHGRICNLEAKPPQSFRSWIFERFIAKSLNQIDLFLVENEDYRRSIEEFNRSAKILETGTLKAVRKRSGPRTLRRERRVAFVSVLEQELPIINDIINNLRLSNSPIMSILLPRYVGSGLPGKDGDSFIARARNIFPALYVVSDFPSFRKAIEAPAGVLVYRNLGRVEDILESSDIAVVCGSLSDSLFLKAKGHNFFEPLAQAIPTIIGPKHRNWRYTVDRLRTEGVLFVAEPDKVAHSIMRLLNDPFRYQEQSRAIHENKYLEYQQLSDERIASHLANFLSAERRRLDLD